MITFWKIATGQKDDYTTGCLFDYNCFNECYKMISIDLSKQQALDANTKAIQQINSTRNQNWGKNAEGQNINDNKTMFSNIEKAKETILDFSQRTVKVLRICFILI